MIRTRDGFTISRTDLTAWVAWFLAAKCEGMEQEVKDSLEQCLGGFFATEAEFASHLIKVSEGIKCPKCHGRGHNNLYLLGSKTPGKCSNCNGTGTIAPNMMFVKGEDPMDAE